jgi:hypothetical protein
MKPIAYQEFHQPFEIIVRSYIARNGQLGHEAFERSNHSITGNHL